MMNLRVTFNIFDLLFIINNNINALNYQALFYTLEISKLYCVFIKINY